MVIALVVGFLPGNAAVIHGGGASLGDMSINSMSANHLTLIGVLPL